jgi:amino acid transporter
MAILTIPVFLTGQEAEEVVEHITGVSEDMIEEHEELAEKAIWLMGLLGVLAIVNLFSISKKMPISKTITLITLVVSLITCGLFAKVGNDGGQIRHSEIRAGFSNSDVKTDGKVKQNRSEREDREGDDDDD